MLNINIESIYDETSGLYNVYNEQSFQKRVEYFNSNKDEFLETLKIRVNKKSCELVSFDIVQFSNFENCTYRLCENLYYSGNKGYTYQEMGGLLLGTHKKRPGALVKYGENHSKTASVLGLVLIQKIDGKTTVFLTNLGYYYYLHEREKQGLLLKYLLLRSNFIIDLLKGAMQGKYKVVDEISFLSSSTINRRLPNLKKIYEELISGIENEMQFITAGVDFSWD